MPVTLWPHQEKSIKLILKRRGFLEGSVPGCGKGIVALELARILDEPCIAVVPASLTHNWMREADRLFPDLKMQKYDAAFKLRRDTNIIVMSYEMMQRCPELFKIAKVYIADECFVAGTQVLTPSGYRSIEDLAIGDEVISAAGVDEVVSTTRRMAYETMQVNGIRCTPNHKFLTESGWINAKNLLVGDVLVGHEYARREASIPDGKRSVLGTIIMSEMREENREGGAHTRRSPSCEVLFTRMLSRVRSIALSSSPSSGEKVSVSHLWEGRRDESNPIKVLFQGLRNIWNILLEREVSPGYCQEDEREKPDGQPGHPGEDESNVEKNRAQAPGARGKWESNGTQQNCPSYSDRDGLLLCGGVGSEAPDTYRRKPRIQVRRWCSRLAGAGRSRWAESLYEEKARTGRVENSAGRGVRVDSVSHIERGCKEVFNLEIRRHPSYVVHGVVVHNCHALCTPSSKRSKAFHHYVKDFKPRRLLLMSGTILKNKIPDLYHPLKLLDFVNNCGFRQAFPSWGSFARQFTHTQVVKRGGFLVTEYDGLRNEEELREWIKPIYIRNTLSETSLPPLRFIEIGIGGGSKKLEAALRAEWGNYQAGKKQEMWGEDEDVVGEEHFSTAKARNAYEKAEKTIGFALDLLTQGLGPLVIFSDHVKAAWRIHEALGVHGRISRCVTGSVSQDKRNDAIELFQSGRLDAICATAATLGVGWTLTAASICIVNDKNWLPSVNRQAMKRIHRIGQTKPCIIYSMVREGIDEQIEAALQRKDAVEQRAMGGLG